MDRAGSAEGGCRFRFDTIFPLFLFLLHLYFNFAAVICLQASARPPPEDKGAEKRMRRRRRSSLPAPGQLCQGPGAKARCLFQAAFLPLSPARLRNQISVFMSPRVGFL